MSERSIWIREKRLSNKYLITTSIPVGKLKPAEDEYEIVYESN